MERENPFGFGVDFWENQVFFGNSVSYATNEMLTEILSSEIDHKYIRQLHKKVLECAKKLDADTDQKFCSEEYILGFDTAVRAFADAVEEVDQYRLKFPPYNRIFADAEPFERVISILDEFPTLWEVPVMGGVYTYRTEKYEPWCLQEPDSYFVDQISPYAPLTDFHEVLDELNYIKIDCLYFLTEVLRFFDFYQELLEKYIHVKSHFLTTDEIAAAFQKYINDHSERQFEYYMKCSNTGSHLRIIEKNGKPLMTEHYWFKDWISIFYLDFIHGLQSNYIPKRCANCGRWFLIRGGKYLEYCSRPLENDPTKTCRDVGAQQSFDQKCKNNPIWEAHRRAYKTHFARRKKGRMTPDEFRIWVDNAIAWRGQAERGELDFDTYCAMLKK